MDSGQGVTARPVVSKWLPITDTLGGHAAGSRPLPPDGELVAKLRDRDEDTFALLVDTWSDGMRRLAGCLVAAEADQVVRDTWLAVINDIATIDGPPSLKTRVFQFLVATARRPVPESADHGPTVDPVRFQDDSEPFPGHWREFPADWPAADTRTPVADAVTRLPVQEQLVVMLTDAEGFRPDEVCEILDIEADTRRTLLHRARAFVRRELEDHFEDRT